MDKPIVHLKTIEEGLYRSVYIDYEKIYGNVKTICDSGYSTKEISGIRYTRLEWVIIFKFDNKGNEIEVDGFDGENAFKYKSLFTYYTDGKIEKQYYYRPGNTLRFTYVYNYDSNRHEVGYDLYARDEDNFPDSKFIDSLDSKGNVIQKSLIEQGQLTLRTFAIVHDDRGNIISSNFTNITDTLEDQFKYDDSDNKTQQTCIEGRKNAIDSIRFKYTNKDIYGNWLKKWVYKNDTLENGTHRKITYYE